MDVVYANFVKFKCYKKYYECENQNLNYGQQNAGEIGTVGVSGYRSDQLKVENLDIGGLLFDL